MNSSKSGVRRTIAIAAIASISGMLVQSPSTAYADAYRWRDASGEEHYGTNPPPNATSIEPLKGKKFSRYSSEKMLRPYQKYVIPRDAAGEPTLGNEMQRPMLKPEKPNEKLVVPGKRADRKITSTDLLPAEEESLKTHVTAGEPVFSLNEKGEVSHCQVLVRNRSSIPVAGVTVRFEFEDGSLIPAKGAQSIPPEGQATYSVPDEVLPIRVSKQALRPTDDAEAEVEDSEGESAPAVLPPKVVIRVGEH